MRAASHVTPNRWQAVLDSKPRLLVDHLLDEVAVLFAKDLAKWPPPLEDVSAEVAELVHQTPQRPDARIYAEAFGLSRMDLAHELEAYDEYLRNRRWLEAGLTVSDKPVLLFLSRLITEQLLAFKEATSGRITRKHLATLLDRTQACFLRDLPC